MTAERRSAPGRPARSPLTGHLMIAMGIGLLFGIFMLVGRAPLPRVVGIVPVIVAATFVLLRALGVDRIDWPSPPTNHTGRIGKVERWRLNGFEAAVDKVPGFSPHLRVRLRELATSILSRHDLTPGSPGAVALLGAREHELLYPPVPRAGAAKPDEPVGGELLALIEKLTELGTPGEPGSPGTAHLVIPAGTVGGRSERHSLT